MGLIRLLFRMMGLIIMTDLITRFGAALDELENLFDESIEIGDFQFAEDIVLEIEGMI